MLKILLTLAFIITFVVLMAFWCLHCFALDNECKSFIIHSAKHDIKMTAQLRNIVINNKDKFNQYTEDLDVLFEAIDFYCDKLINEVKNEGKEGNIRALVYIISNTQIAISNIFKECNVDMPNFVDI